MKSLGLITLALLCTGFAATGNAVFPGSVSETASDVILFGDTLIHQIELQFYVEDWQDSLTYNYEILDGEYIPARLTFDGHAVLDSIGVRYKGHSSYELSRSTPKKPFEFKFDKYRDDQKLADQKKLNVQNCVSDPSFMRETIAYGIARRYMPAPRTAYADVHVNGELLGFYVLVEQIDKTFLSKYFEDNDGNLFKAGDDGATLEYHGTDPESYEDELELKTNEDESDWTGFTAFLDRLNNCADTVFVDTVRGCFNFDSALRMLAFNMVLSSFDSYTGSGRNFYLYDDPTSGQFQILLWDLNESFGVYPNGWDVITQNVLNISNFEHRPLNRRILEHDSLRQIYLGYIHEMVAGPAAEDSVAEIAEGLRPLIQSHVYADSNKLYSNASFDNNIEQDVYVDFGRRIPGIKSFSRTRNANLRLQLSDEIVYPGDTDNNGIVNALDILPIGVYFMSSGVARQIVTFAWGAQGAVLWENPAATYADADGNGTIDERDVIAIGLHWGNQHEALNSSFALTPDLIASQKQYLQSFRTIYNSLSGAGQPVFEMRSLIESLLNLDDAVSASLSLNQNYPNPFNQETTIRFSLPARQTVSLSLIDILGRTVSQPIHGIVCNPGYHRIQFDAGELSSGVYFYRLETEQGNLLRKMVVLK